MYFCSNYNGLEKLDDESFRLAISKIIEIEEESSFLDYKKEIHDNKAELIKDIMSLANNTEDKDGLLIFGVKNKELFNVDKVKFEEFVVGLLEGNRRKFASQIIPKIYVRSCKISGKNLEIIIIKNSSNTPYYLVDEYKCKNVSNDKDVTIKPYEVYTRNNSNKGLAFDFEIEKLWAKRFGLNKTSLEKFLTMNNNSWKFINKNATDFSAKYVFNEINPEYVIRFSEAKGISNNPYSHVLNIFNGYEKCYKGRMQLFFHSTIIFEEDYYFMKDCEYKNGKQRYIPSYNEIVVANMKYYYLDSIQGKLIRILNKGELNFHNGRKELEYGHYLVFYNEKDFINFAEFIIKYLKLEFTLLDSEYHLLYNIESRINEMFYCDTFRKCFDEFSKQVSIENLSILPQNFQHLLRERNHLLTENSFSRPELLEILEKAFHFKLYLEWRNITENIYIDFVANMH